MCPGESSKVANLDPSDIFGPLKVLARTYT